MQAVENWANITGRLVASNPHPELKGYLSTTLEVKDARPVPGFANLFESSKGQTIEVNVPATAADYLEKHKGAIVSWQLRKAGPTNNFAHPDVGS